jgi:ketosteroid isomerase-like protein
MSPATVDQIAEQFVSALKGDINRLKDICAPDCQLWHSNDAKWMAQAPALEAFAEAQKAGLIPEFGELVITPTAKGFLSQTTMTLAPVGKMQIVQLITVEGGKITVIEEYIAPEMDLSNLAQA